MTDEEAEGRHPPAGRQAGGCGARPSWLMNNEKLRELLAPR